MHQFGKNLLIRSEIHIHASDIMGADGSVAAISAAMGRDAV
jgi:hypothetical protein